MAESVKDVSDRGSAQYVAWLLFRGIAASEKKYVGDWVEADKDWTLRTYAQCLAVTNGLPADVALKK